MGTIPRWAMLAAGILVSLTILGCSKKREQKLSFSPLSEAESSELNKRRAIVAAIAKNRYGFAGFDHGESDLSVLQRILDEKVFTKTGTYELEALGVVFGDVVAGDVGLHWETVTDAWGKHAALRFKQTTIYVNAMDMIAKRVEEDRGVSFAELRIGLKKGINEMIASGNYK